MKSTSATSSSSLFSFARLLLVVVFVSFLLMMTTTQGVSASPKVPEDPDHPDHPKNVKDGMSAEDVRTAGHLAHYVLASVIRFPDMKFASDRLADMESGKSNFRSVAEEMNRYYMVQGETAQTSGEVGLITMNEVEPELAKLLFDIRHPEADEKSMNLVGPVETEHGVFVGAAFKRYRKSFFSDPWWDLEFFSRQSKMKTSDMLQLIENQDRLWQVAFMIWPEEHVTFKRIKLRQIKGDFRKIGMEDPATRMPPPKPKMAPHLHKARIDERVAFMKKIDPKVIDAHPEVYAMSYEEIRQRGWHPDDAAVKRAKERYASESKSSSNAEKEVDPSKFAL